MSVNWSAIRHVLLDMDGTIYRGTTLFDCTLPFLSRLDSLRIGYSFLTNNTSKSPADYVIKLKSLGVEAKENAIFTAGDHFIEWAKRNVAEISRLCIVGTESLVAQLQQAGYSDDWDHPEAVLIGYDPALCLPRLGKAAYWVQKGLPFYATHPDLVCPGEETTVLIDCGAVCACVTAATGRKPQVFGKPDPGIIWSLCQRLGLAPDQILMVGDRLYTDIAMAQNAGTPSALVLSGEAVREDLPTSPIVPDFVAADIGELGHYLQLAATDFAACLDPISTEGMRMISTEQLFLRLLIAAIFGGIIGLERGRLEQAAGLRTHAMVCLGSSLIMIVSSYGFQHIRLERNVVLDPSRVAAQVVSGIGFLGAGTIIMRREVIRGLTTAASLWAVAGIGLAVGGGLYLAAFFSTLIGLGILAGIKPLEYRFNSRYSKPIIRALVKDSKAPSLQSIREALDVAQTRIYRITIEGAPNANHSILDITLQPCGVDRQLAAVEQLQRVAGISRVNSEFREPTAKPNKKAARHRKVREEPETLDVTPDSVK